MPVISHRAGDQPPWCWSAAVPVGLMRAGDLTRQVRERDELLRPGREVLELDLAVRQLVAEDDREVGLVARGGL